MWSGLQILDHAYVKNLGGNEESTLYIIHVHWRRLVTDNLNRKISPKKPKGLILYIIKQFKDCMMNFAQIFYYIYFIMLECFSYGCSYVILFIVKPIN